MLVCRDGPDVVVSVGFGIHSDCQSDVRLLGWPGPDQVTDVAEQHVWHPDLDDALELPGHLGHTVESEAIVAAEVRVGEGTVEVVDVDLANLTVLLILLLVGLHNLGLGPLLGTSADSPEVTFLATVSTGHTCTDGGGLGPGVRCDSL